MVEQGEADEVGELWCIERQAHFPHSKSHVLGEMAYSNDEFSCYPLILFSSNPASPQRDLELIPIRTRKEPLVVHKA